MSKLVDERALAQAKRASTGQLLLKCARLWDELAIDRVNLKLGATVLRPAHTKLLPHIDFEGTRIVTIAERLGVTKQAVSQWIGELSQLKVVELIDDPQDGRAKLVRFTRRGMEAITEGLQALGQIEQDLIRRVGAKSMAALRTALGEVAPALEALATEG